MKKRNNSRTALKLAPAVNVCNRDSSSLSGGTSSGCGNNETDDTKLASNECGNQSCESYYVTHRDFPRINSVKF